MLPGPKGEATERRLRHGDQSPSKTTFVFCTFDICRDFVIEGSSGAIFNHRAPSPLMALVARFQARPISHHAVKNLTK
jgi:hypothetical protein